MGCESQFENTYVKQYQVRFAPQLITFWKHVPMVWYHRFWRAGRPRPVLVPLLKIGCEMANLYVSTRPCRIQCCCTTSSIPQRIIRVYCGRILDAIFCLCDESWFVVKTFPCWSFFGLCHYHCVSYHTPGTTSVNRRQNMF